MVSAFASPSADPHFDSSKGLEVFDKYMMTGNLSAYGTEQATIWGTDSKGKRYDTGKLKFDEKGNPVYKQVAKAYATTSLEKFNNIVNNFNGDVSKAVNWVLSNHSFDDASKMMGKPTTGAKANQLDENEYFTKENGGTGVFAITGAKLGSYILNRIGDYSTVTKDMWYARTLARLAGESLTEKGKAIKSPWASNTKQGLRKRKLADKAFEIVAKKLGTSPADVQQKIWDFEKRLYEKLGAVEKTSYASDGLKSKAKQILSQQPSKIKFQKNLPQSVEKRLTEDENGNYVFHHYSRSKRDSIKPTTGDGSFIVSKDEASALASVNGVAQYYAMADQVEQGVGGVQHTVLVPKDEVYYLQDDKLNLYDKAKEEFQKARPGQAFNPNYQAAWIGKVANDMGYKMLVSEWKNGELRAQTTLDLKPELENTQMKPREEVSFNVGDKVNVFGDDAVITEMNGDIAFYKGEKASGSINVARNKQSIVKLTEETSSKIKKQLIGKNANLSQNVRDNLQIARDMENAKKDAKTIRIATGWERGADKKWRYEVPDIKFKKEFEGEFLFPIDKLERIPSGKYVAKLSDLFDAKSLFESYNTEFQKELPLYNEDGTIVESAILYKNFEKLENIDLYFQKGGYSEGSYDPMFNDINISFKPGNSTNE
jgi:hypothetical protein